VNDTVRVWRVRKNHTWIDARLQERAPAPDVELQFFYDGTLVFARRCATRGAALAQADVYRKNLERAGWNAHW
jgi:hypothetical protein